jgi:hypothetical protein
MVNGRPPAVPPWCDAMEAFHLHANLPARQPRYACRAGFSLSNHAYWNPESAFEGSNN